jgi:hypothetical protein
MDEDRFNMALRKFLKEVGVTSQREVEKLVRERATQAGTLRLRMVLTSPDAPGLNPRGRADHPARLSPLEPRLRHRLRRLPTALPSCTSTLRTVAGGPHGLAQLLTKGQPPPAIGLKACSAGIVRSNLKKSQSPVDSATVLVRQTYMLCTNLPSSRTRPSP